jgi:hypothetical protein
MLKKSASGIGRLRLRLRLREKVPDLHSTLTLTSTSAYMRAAALLDGLFEHPAGIVEFPPASPA